MGNEGGRQPGYRATLRADRPRKLYIATAVSGLGDYVGQGALLLLAFERSGGRVLGSAALFAVGALPGLLSGAFAGTWLDRLPRDRTLMVAQLLGGALILLPLLIGGLPIVFVTAACLGALRAVMVSVRSGVLAEAIEDRHRGPLLALISTTEQIAQVVGLAAGASLFVVVDAGIALGLDAVTFLVAAVVLSRLRLPRPEPRDHRPPVTAGLRDIFADPVLRLLAPLVWLTGIVGSLPEALAPGVTNGDGAWTAAVLAAAPLGQAAAMLVAGRTRQLARPSAQLIHLAWLALALGIAALGRTPLWFAISNLLVGSGVAWYIGPQLTFVRIAPPERMAQITGTMIALLIAAEGLGTPAFAYLADQTSVSTAYRVAGYLVLAAALIGWLIKERTPAATKLDEDVLPI